MYSCLLFLYFFIVCLFSCVVAFPNNGDCSHGFSFLSSESGDGGLPGTAAQTPPPLYRIWTEKGNLWESDSSLFTYRFMVFHWCY